MDRPPEITAEGVSVCQGQSAQKTSGMCDSGDRPIRDPIDHLGLLHTEKTSGQMIHHFALFLPSLLLSLNISQKEGKNREGEAQ